MTCEIPPLTEETQLKEQTEREKFQLVLYVSGFYVDKHKILLFSFSVSHNGYHCFVNFWIIHHENCGKRAGKTRTFTLRASSKQQKLNCDMQKVNSFKTIAMVMSVTTFDNVLWCDLVQKTFFFTFILANGNYSKKGEDLFVANFSNFKPLSLNVTLMGPDLKITNEKSQILIKAQVKAEDKHLQISHCEALESHRVYANNSLIFCCSFFFLFEKSKSS